MRILYIGNKLAKHGNNRTSIDTLGHLLAAEGFQMHYASSSKNQVVRMAEMIFKTIGSFKKTNYVLIDTYSTNNFWYALIISQLCRLLQLKYIPILHGGNLPHRLKKNSTVSKMIFSHSHTNVSPSKYLLSAFNNAGFDNVIYIPNSIEIKDYTFKQRKKLRCKLLWVRSFAQIYNPQMALRVAKQLSESHPQVELCMVGPDKENMLPELCKLAVELNIKVEFTGGLSKQQWISLADNYDIFLNCTHFDNMPVSVIEAMALGLPVVSTNVGGLPYLLEHEKTALLSDDDDVQMMTLNIFRLLSDPDKAAEISQNARKVAEQFDWPEVKQKWLEILH